MNIRSIFTAVQDFIFPMYVVKCQRHCNGSIEETVTENIEAAMKLYDLAVADTQFVHVELYQNGKLISPPEK